MSELVRVPTYTAAQVRAAEAPLLTAGEPLMARAAAALGHLVRGELAGDTDTRATGSHAAASTGRGRILVLAGSGDNGADALYAASALADVADVDIVLTGSRAHPEALAAARATGATPIDVADVDPRAYDIVIDGILGIGTAADPALRGVARRVVSALLPAVREGRPRVVAADLPSGLHPDTGETSDDVVLPASLTVTFGAVKAGLPAAPHVTGRIVLVELGLRLPDGGGTADVARYVHVTGV